MNRRYGTSNDHLFKRNTDRIGKAEAMAAAEARRRAWCDKTPGCHRPGQHPGKCCLQPSDHLGRCGGRR